MIFGRNVYNNGDFINTKKYVADVMSYLVQHQAKFKLTMVYCKKNLLNEQCSWEITAYNKNNDKMVVNVPICTKSNTIIQVFTNTKDFKFELNDNRIIYMVFDIFITNTTGKYNFDNIELLKSLILDKELLISYNDSTIAYGFDKEGVGMIIINTPDYKYDIICRLKAVSAKKIIVESITERKVYAASSAVQIKKFIKKSIKEFDERRKKNNAKED